MVPERLTKLALEPMVAASPGRWKRSRRVPDWRHFIKLRAERRGLPELTGYSETLLALDQELFAEEHVEPEVNVTVMVVVVSVRRRKKKPGPRKKEGALCGSGHGCQARKHLRFRERPGPVSIAEGRLPQQRQWTVSASGIGGVAVAEANKDRAVALAWNNKSRGTSVRTHKKGGRGIVLVGEIKWKEEQKREKRFIRTGQQDACVDLCCWWWFVNRVSRLGLPSLTG